MKKINKLKLWLIAMIFAMPCIVFGQANYMTIFGAANTSTNNFKLNCTVPTSSSALTQSITNITDIGSIYADYFKNSCYDKNGNLLFTVNADGIYDNVGFQQYSFIQLLSYNPCGTSGIGINYYLQNAVSEIVIVPVPNVCNNYYVIFWSHYQTAGGVNAALLRTVQVFIDPNISTASSLIVLADNVLNQPTCATDGFTTTDNGFFDNGFNTFEVVADAANPDGSRDIYTLNIQDSSATLAVPFTALRQWHIGADGTLPTAATQLTACVLGASQTLLPPNTTKAKIFTIGGNKILSYIAAPYIATSVTNHYIYGASMQTYNLTSTAHEAIVYQAPISYPSTDYDYQQIWGFEYLPTQNMFCFAYVDINTSSTPNIFNGGLGYAAPSSTNTTFTAIALTDGLNYRNSDLELNNHNDLFLVYQDDAGNGTVKYLSASALTGFPSSVSPVACSTSVAANVPILNWQMKVNLLTGYGSWYFGNQIRGENYNNWGDFANQVYGQQVITTDVTWSPTSNPTGTTTDHILIDTNIIIAPGGTLHIENMTLEMAKGTSIIVQNSPTSTGWGGILYVRSSTITSSFGCGIKSTWSGIKVEGDPSYPPCCTGSNMPQGNAYINYSTISYADIGIQNGSYPSTTYSGGNMSVGYTSFINNSTSVLLNPYTYMSSYGELATSISFISCSFNNDAATIFPMVFMAVVKNVKGAMFNSCTFNNNIGTMSGIYNIDGDTKIDFSTFNNCNTGIYSASASGTHSASIYYNTFNNNQYGVVSRGDIAIDIQRNIFNIPKYTGCCPTTYQHSDALLVNDQNIGALMISSTGYKMSYNMFHTNAPTGSYFDYTSGTLESNTGSDVNHITNNSFKGLGVAMNSNFVNNNVGLGGLRYLCNADTNVYCDIGVFGDNLHHGGIIL